MSESKPKETGKPNTESEKRRDPTVRKRVRINGRFLLVLSLVAVVLGTGTYLLHGWQVKQNAGSLLDVVDEAEARGENEQAIRFLAQYLRFVPDDYDAKVRLANLYERNSRSARVRFRVLGILEDVLRNDPDRADAEKLRRRLVELGLGLGRFRDALTHVEMLQKASPGDAELTFFAGECHEGLAEFDKAVVGYLAAIQQSQGTDGPKETAKFYVALAALLERRPDVVPTRDELREVTSPVRLDDATIGPFPAKTAAGERNAPRPPAVALRPGEHSTTVPMIYDLLVKSGRPKHTARLARANYRISRQLYQRAQEDVERAEAIAQAKGNDPDVLATATRLHLAWAGQIAFDVQYGSRRLAELQAHLDEARSYARRGSRLSRPDNLRFFAPLARVEQQRAALAKDFAGRTRHLKQGREYLNQGVDAVREYRDSDAAKDLAPAEAGRLLVREIELRGLRVDLLLSLARREDGSLDRSLLDGADSDYAADMKELAALGAGTDRLALYQARELLARGQWREAAQELVRASRQAERSQTVRREIARSLAECQRQLRNSGRRIQTLRDALLKDSAWLEGRLLYAAALANANRLEEAIRQYALSRTNTGLLEAVRLQIRQQSRLPQDRRDLTAVFANLKRAAANDEPNDVAIALLKSDAYLLEPASPRAATRGTGTKKPAPAGSSSLDKARAVLDAALGRHPGNVRLQVALVRLDFAARAGAGKDAAIRQALKRLREIGAKVPGRKGKSKSENDDDRLIVLGGRAQLALGLPHEDAAEEFQKIQAAAATLGRRGRIASLKTVARGYGALAFMSQRPTKPSKTVQPRKQKPVNAGEDEAARKRRSALIGKSRAAWEQVLELAPNDLGARLELAQLAVREGNRDQLQKQLVAIRAIEGENEAWGNYFAALGLMRSAFERIETARAGASQAEQSQIKKQVREEFLRAQSLLERVTRLRTDWALPYRQLGRVAERLADRREAYENYQRAIDLGDRSPDALLFAADYLFRNGRNDEAQRIVDLGMRRQSAGRPGDEFNFSDRKMTLSELDVWLLLRRGKFKQVQERLPRDSRDYSTNMLAALAAFAEYRALDDAHRSDQDGQALLAAIETRIRAAIAAGPKAPARPWIAWVMLLAQVKQRVRAERVIAEARRELPDELKDVTAARCYVLLKDVEQAEKSFQRAVAAYPEDVKVRLAFARFYLGRKLYAAAERQLNAVRGPKSKATPAERQAILSTLALAVAARGRPEELQRALQLLPRREDATRQDLLAYVAVLSKGRRREDRRMLISVLEQLDGRPPGLKDNDRFQLARLYEKMDRWADARKVMQELLGKQPKNALFLGWYAVELLHHEKDRPQVLATVRDLVTRLKIEQAGSLTTAAAEAELLIAEDRRDDAGRAIVDAVERIARNKKQLETAEMAQVLLAAKLAEKLQLYPVAGQLLREYPPRAKNPEALLSLATYLGRRGRYQEALELCRRVATDKRTSPAAVAVAAATIVARGEPDVRDFQMAEELIGRALQAAPKSERLKLMSADFLTSAGRLQEAEAAYRKLLAADPRSVPVLNNLAWMCAIRRQHLRDALVWSSKAIELAGPLATLLDTKAVVLLQMQQPDDAIVLLEQAIEEQPDPSFYLHLAQAHLAAGNRPAAIEAMRKAFAAGLAEVKLHRLERPGFRATVEATGVRS